MNRSFILKILLTVLFFLLMSPLVRAKGQMKKGMKHISNSLIKDFAFSNDTTKYQQQDKKKEKSKEKSDNKEKPDHPDIREVPKARKQTRPSIVVKPNVKVKPIKIIRPNIKRP